MAPASHRDTHQEDASDSPKMGSARGAAPAADAHGTSAADNIAQVCLAERRAAPLQVTSSPMKPTILAITGPSQEHITRARLQPMLPPKDRASRVPPRFDAVPGPSRGTREGRETDGASLACLRLGPGPVDSADGWELAQCHPPQTSISQIRVAAVAFLSGRAARVSSCAGHAALLCPGGLDRAGSIFRDFFSEEDPGFSGRLLIPARAGRRRRRRRLCPHAVPSSRLARSPTPLENRADKYFVF